MANPAADVLCGCGGDAAHVPYGLHREYQPERTETCELGLSTLSADHEPVGATYSVGWLLSERRQ